MEKHQNVHDSGQLVALDRALQYHSVAFKGVTEKPTTPDEIIATASKFLRFLLKEDHVTDLHVASRRDGAQEEGR